MANGSMANQQPPQPLYSQQGRSRGWQAAMVIGFLVLLLLLGAWWLMRQSADDEERGSLMEEGEGEEVLPMAEPTEDDFELTPTLSPTPTGTSSNLIENRTQIRQVAPGETEVNEFTLEAANFRFTPNEMRVGLGEQVRLTLVNNSTMPHDWRVDEFQAATRVINTGEQDTIEFVADQPGQFEFYCSVGQHRQQGMVGQLIVE